MELSGEPFTHSAQIAPCQACASESVYVERIVCTARRTQGVGVTFSVCRRCGLAFAPGNAHSYESASSFASGSKPGVRARPRVGDGKRAGREFHMAAMGVSILQRSSPSVLVLGAGLSRDFALIKRKLKVSRSAVSDFGNFLEADDFVPLDAKDPFDIVIASEVIEHFADFERDFGNLFSKRAENGIVIAGTNINDGTPVGRVVYPFSRGHAAYYSGQSLKWVAERFGLELDFRPPRLVFEGGSPRKRYVIFGKREEMSLVSVYFSSHPVAPSERRKPPTAVPSIP